SLTFQALAANSSAVGGPPFVIGLDASPAMLAAVSKEKDLAGIRIPGLPCAAVPGAREDDARLVDIAIGVQWQRQRYDRVLADLAQPLPFRSGIADGVLSVSAVQWLLDGRPEPSSVSAQATDQGEQAASSTSLLGPQTRLRRLFRCLRQASVPCARMALQFYPPKGDHDFGARALVDASRAEGFDADVVLDFPHRGTAKKWVLVAQAPPALDVDSRNFEVSKSSLRRQGQPAWCALCWPVVAGCC
ncbi:unnamed protein product, partial [Polarella glacialis]